VRKQGLNAIAITDHDTTGGIAEAQQAAEGSPVVIPGVELSAEADGVDAHMLGYYVELDNADFQAALARFRDVRLERGRQIVERLTELGMPIHWEDVLAQADGGTVGRPHVARVLLQAGYVASVQEAFDLYLHSGGPADVARPQLSPAEAVALIHQAGGAAVLAHPGLVPDYILMVERLVNAGLDGIEIMHPSNSAIVRANLRGLAARYDLIITGGSDFHRMGDLLGAEQPPRQAIRALRERAGMYHI
jgi:predicted metal-dependent phosphoesterase TrpH